MNKLLTTLLIAFMAFGCGGQQEAKMQQKTEMAETRKDYISEGFEYLKASDPVSAIRSFDEAIKQNPLNPQGYIVLGQTYMRMQEYDRAVDSFSAATRVAPKQGEVYYLLAMSHGLAGNKEDAIESVKVSAELFRMNQDETNFAKAMALYQGLQGLDVSQDSVSIVQP